MSATPIRDALPIAQIFPPTARDALIAAAAVGNCWQIDRITDMLARFGYVRERTSESLAHRFEVDRELRAALANMRFEGSPE